ncbi:hypothetical protein LWI28_006805 [Acer negundo]|uniref:Pectinesterase inhibitor domain-containing protein n=1 Tax=Acer negundo TaxID=4023 RepID=A0AAD5J3C6_ACENE|nr:hypothetical protein LWI28_006805 [Acer negundo]
MASYDLVRSALFLLVVASMYFSPSSGVSQDVLATICGQTQNQETCEEILLSDQRTSSADPPLLSLISLEQTMKRIDRNFDAFSQFQDNTTDPALKIAFENCVTLYQNIKDILRADYKLSQHGKYDRITDLGQLTTLAYNCENGISSSISPTAGITEDMLLIAQTAVYTNSYVAGS